jgi:hypothetical protein
MIFTLHGLVVIAEWVLGAGLFVGAICYAASRIEELDAEAEFRLRERLFPIERYGAFTGGERLKGEFVVLDAPVSMKNYEHLRQPAAERHGGRAI